MDFPVPKFKVNIWGYLQTLYGIRRVRGTETKPEKKLPPPGLSVIKRTIVAPTNFWFKLSRIDPG